MSRETNPELQKMYDTDKPRVTEWYNSLESEVSDEKHSGKTGYSAFLESYGQLGFWAILYQELLTSDNQYVFLNFRGKFYQPTEILQNYAEHLVDFIKNRNKSNPTDINETVFLAQLFRDMQSWQYYSPRASSQELQSISEDLGDFLVENNARIPSISSDSRTASLSDYLLDGFSHMIGKKPDLKKS